MEHAEPPVVVESAAVPNVGATGDLVVVNPRWMDEVSGSVCGSDAVCERDLVRGIAGHEWGHVVDSRRPSPPEGDRHTQELDADRTAGRVLSQMGSSTEPLVRLLQSEGSVETATHPGGAERERAVCAGQREGQRCRGIGRCRCDEWRLSAAEPKTESIGASCAQ